MIEGNRWPKQSLCCVPLTGSKKEENLLIIGEIREDPEAPEAVGPSDKQCNIFLSKLDPFTDNTC